jgi:hypothetical protein
MTMNKAFERAMELGKRKPPVINRQRLAQTAEAMSRAGDMQLHLDACVAATVAFVNVLFATDADGQPANFDPYAGTILIPVPWGSGGWKRWGLRKWEATCYRRLLLDRVERRSGGAFDYNEHTRQWLIDSDQYTTANDVLIWLKDNEPLLREWRPIVDAYRAREAKRKMGLT